MTPAALFAAVAALAPTPMELIEAGAYIRCPQIEAVVTNRHRPAMLAVGVRLELVGPEDHIGFLPEWGDFEGLDAATVLVLLRDLHAELRDAPPLADAARLPPAAVCHEAAAFNRRLASRFRDRALWEPDREGVLSAAAAECDAYCEFWWTAANAANGFGVAQRRRSLAYIRDAIGREAWAAGRLPDFVPGHLFHAR